MIRLPNRRDCLAAGLAIPCFPATCFGRSPRPPITCVQFTPDGKRVLAGSQTGIAIYDAVTGESLDSLSVDMDNVHDLAWTNNGTLLAAAGGTAGESGVVQFISWPDRQLRQRVEPHDDLIYKITFAADGERWATASGDEVCTVHHVDPTAESDRSQPAKSNDKPVRFTKHSRPVLAAAFLPDSRTIVTASRDQTLRVWDALTGNDIRVLHNHSADVNALALSPRTEGLPMVASASADMTVRFWQPTIGRMVRFAKLESQPLCIAWADQGNLLVAGCQDGKARLVDPETVEIIESRDVSGGWLYSLAVDPKADRRLAFGTLDGHIELVTW